MFIFRIFFSIMYIIRLLKPRILEFSISSKKGFTLIELLVVFSLTAFIAGIGIVAFAAYGRSQSLTQAVSQTKLLIQESRFNALSSVLPQKTPDGDVIDCGSSGLGGYKVQINIAQNNAQSYLFCGNQTTFLIKQVNLPSNITMGSDTTCDQIQFDTVSAQAVGGNCSILIEGYGARKSLSVDLVGNITVTDI